MQQQRNPIVQELAEQLSGAEVRMLNALEAAYRLLEREATSLYEEGADSQAGELDAVAEQIMVRIEEIAEEVLDEGEGFLEGDDVQTGPVSLEQDLARAYRDWLLFVKGEVTQRVFFSREEFIDMLRRIAHLHPSYGHHLDKSVTDEQMVDAARDAYIAEMERRRILGR